jgi:drug/metabolite transporter (DMT)-like permease
VTRAVAAAFVAALCYGLAAVFQQREAAAAPARKVGRPALLWHLAGRPLWLAGAAAALAGGGMHVLALSWGPLVQVQPVGATAPVFAVFLRSALGGGRPRSGDVGGAAAVCAGLGGLLASLRPERGTPGVGVAVLATLAAAGGVVLATALAGGWWLRGVGRPLLLAAGAGVALGLVSSLVRVLAVELTGAPAAAAVLASAAAAAAVFVVLGQLLLQSAYHTGGLALVQAAVTVVDPVTAGGVGIVWLRERTLIALPGPAITGSLLIVAGVVVLARSATGSGPAPAARPAAEPPAGRPAPAGGETRSRILIGTDTYPPHVNGAAVFTRRLAHGLACRGHDVHVVCPASASTRAGGTQPEGPVLVHRLPARPVPRHAELSYCPPWRVRSQTARTVEQVKPDVIHIQTHDLIGRTLTRLAGRSGIPLVATNHFMPDTLLAPSGCRASSATGWPGGAGGTAPGCSAAPTP